jgi:heat induced stress protein YflT
MAKKNSSYQKQGAVVALFHDAAQAELAIRGLKDQGFTGAEIGVLMRDGQRQHQLADAGGSKVSGAAATGAIGGGVAGGVIGLLAGVGALAIPGIGPIIAGGALASTLAGAGIGAAAGGVIGALVGMGIPEEDARFFERGVRSGGVLITVKAGSRGEAARELLLRYGGELGAGRSAASTRTADHESASGGQSHQSDAWRGNERRYHDDEHYTGPERRVMYV